MAAFVLFKHATVKDGERALLSREGRFERMLEPGRHRLFDPTDALTVETFAAVKTEFPLERYKTLKAARPDLVEQLFEYVDTRSDQVAIVHYDGRPAIIQGPWQTRVYWKIANTVEVERIDIDAVPRVDSRHLAMMGRDGNTQLKEWIVENHEAGLLRVEGRFVERLEPGRHTFWANGPKVEVEKVDLRPKAIEITAQELLTKDRVGVRVTLTAFRRVTDPAKVAQETADVDGWLHRLAQFAIRESVAARTLDEVLAGREALDAELAAFVRARLADAGLEVTEIGVKDIILPGEIRTLVNKVIEAERVAKANLIRRQEETAATRSLLNTARLMEENPLLLRLKELESIERLVEKVGKIDLHAGEGRGLDALLTGLVRLKAPDADK